MRFTTFFSNRGASRLAGVAAAALAGAAVSGCSTDSLTAVTTPDVVQPSAVQTVSALPAVFNSAVGELAYAFSGNNGSNVADEVLLSGLLGDEFLLSDTYPTRREIDYRSTQLTNGDLDGFYRQLQVARVAAERSTAAYTSLMSSIPASSMTSSLTSQSEAYSLAGYAYIFFAETFCGNVPFSTLNTDGTVVYAPGNSTTQILTIASAKFDSAIAVATTVGSGATSQLRLAKIGKARVLLDQGNYAAAAALVTGESNVPTTYNYTIYSSTNTSRQNNGIWSFNRSQRRFSVATGEGTNGLVFRGSASTSGSVNTVTVDPRVVVVRGNGSNNSGFDGSALYVAVKYSEQAAPTILASGVEARLIEAEAAMAAGNYATALTTLNALRANTSLYACPTGVTLSNFSCPTATAATTLAPLTDPGTTKGRVLQLFSARAFWMYGTAHRLGDMRRLSRVGGGTSGFLANGLSSYGDVTGGVNSVFPVGVYAPQSSVNYGSNVALPVPYEEQSANPKYDPNACNPNTP